MLRRPPLRHVCLVLVIVVVTGLPSLFAEGSHALPFKLNTASLVTCSAPCIENFDGVTAPSLPAGWTATIPTGLPGDLLWRTVNTVSDSAPNSASANDPDHVTDNRLTSGAFAIVSSSAVMTFRRRNNLETNYDGMALEISLDAGTFQDIITAGGSFASGGYNGTISTSFGSPISGRLAWTGDTGGFVTTIVNLPSSANGRSVAFRWRVATDNSIGGVGAFIDSITLTGFALPPTNDDFRNAQTIVSASGVINGTNVGATKETAEPNHADNPGGSSVWYRWQAPDSGRFTFTTFGSNFDTVLAVYTGDSLPGTSVASNVVDPGQNPFSGPCGPRISRVSFNAVGGVVYNIAVDRRSTGDSGNITLRWGRSATITGRITDVSGRPVPGIATLGGDACRDTESGGVHFTDVPIGGSYTVNVQPPPNTFANYNRYGTNQSIAPLTGDVSNFNYYQSTPAYSISGTISMPGGDASGLTVRCASTGAAIFSTSANVTSSGSYSCSGLPIFGDYVVTPSMQGFNFSPATRTITFLFQNTTNVNFTGTRTYVISGRVTHPNGTTGVSGVSIALSGSQTASRLTDANGNYSFSGLTEGGNYTVTPSNTNYTFTPPSLSFNNLIADQTANFTANPFLYLLLEESGTVVNQVAALDSMLLVRDPFPVINSANLLNRTVDPNTRVIIFVSNFQLGPSEPPSSVVINLIGSNNQTYDIPAEDVRPLPDFGFTQIVFRLPDSLTAGTCTVTVRAHGQTSNPGTMRITN